MRLIDADAFSAFIKKVVHEHGYDGDGALRICDALTVGDVLNSVCAELDGTALEGFKNAPTVDAAQVVRCKECKWWHDWNGECYGNSNMGYGVGRKADDFCSWGERKDGEKA